MISIFRPQRINIAALWLIVLLAPWAGFAVEPVRVVATGGRIGYTFHDPTNDSQTGFRHRSPHKLGGPVAEMRIGFMDWMYTDKTEFANATNEVTIAAAWLERASTGQVVPLTFSGARQLVLPMNSTTPVWLSDPVPSSVWIGAAPARDEVFWLHATGSIPEGGKVPVGTPTAYAGARFVMYPPASDPGTRDVAGPIPAITGSTARIDGLALVFLGRYTGPGHLAVIGIGDSILNGSGDNSAAVVSGYGFFNRAAVDATGNNTIATFNLTRSGQTAAAWVSPTKQSRQTPFLRYANVLVEEHGTNDLGSAGTGSPTTILANVEKIWTAARAAGVQKILRTNLLPRTTSVPDGWMTFVAQTPNVGWGATNDKRDQINAGLAAALAAKKIDVLVDTLGAVAHPDDDHYWQVNGIKDYLTGDGTHPSAKGHELLAVPLRAALLSLNLDEFLSYTSWSAAIEWGGADSSAGADPNADGISNLLAYALDLSPINPVAPGDRPRAELDTATPDGPWLAFTYREKATAPDLIYQVQSSSDLGEWSALVIDGVNAVVEVVNPDPDGDGSAVLRRVRVKQAADGSPRYLRLKVVK